MKILNQLAYKGTKFGKKKATDMGDYGCKLFCFAMITGIDPVTLDKLFVEKNVYFGDAGDLIDDTAAAKALGWGYKGIDRNINNMPGWEPTIKEVDFSVAAGKQQHFVVRLKDSILDPYEGVERKKNFYEEKTKAPNWENGHFSYRLFVVPEGSEPTPTPQPCDDCLKERDALKKENEGLKADLEKANKKIKDARSILS